MTSPGLPLDDGLRTYFSKEITRARALRDEYLTKWQVEDNLKRYDPAEKHADGVNIAVDFRDVERKKASLFYDLPAVSFRPSGEGHAVAAVLHQELINGLLSDLKMQTKAMALQCVQDCLVAIQPAATKIGYLPTQVPVERPLRDKLTGQPMLDAQGQPVVEMVPVTVHDEFFWSRISNRALLLPAGFRDTVYDRAPWIGYEWKKAKSQVMREYDLPDDWEIPASQHPHPISYTEEKEDDKASDPKVAGVSIYYYAALLDPQVSHPLLMRCLVLVEGQETPLKHADAPWQTLEPDGRLSDDSMIGYPIHPLALRDRPDSAWVPADSSQTGPLTTELNTYVQQEKQRRDGNRLLMGVDVEKIHPEAMDRIKSLDALKGLHLVPLQAGSMAGGIRTAIDQIPTPNLGRENYVGLQWVEKFRDQILGISENQGGVLSSKAKTATEQTITQRNTEARFEQERQRVLSWWLAGVRKLSALVIRYGDRQAEEILGPARAAQWKQFRAMPVVDPQTQQPVLGPDGQPQVVNVLGTFTMEVAIDSGQYQDIEARRRQTLQIFNFLAKSPFVNQQALHAKIFQDFGWDPTEMQAQPQPPKPEPPKVSLTIRGEDFAGPQAPIVLDLLAKVGYPVDPAAVANTLKALGALQQGDPGQAQPPGQALALPSGVPSTAEPANRLDQHQLDLTGGLSGPGPM